ncbi:Carboxymethylenebutenolidase-like protein [Drosera capensis]
MNPKPKVPARYLHYHLQLAQQTKLMYQASGFAVMKSNPITSKSAALFTEAPPRLRPTPRHLRPPPLPNASGFAVMKSNPITSKSAALFTEAPPRLRPTPRHLRPPPLPNLSSRFVKARDAKASYGETEVEDDLNEEACELVSGAELTIREGDDAVNAHLFKAVKNNNGTGIILLSDIFGFEDSFTRDFAYRVACNGFNVLVPDLFRGDPWAREKPRELFGEWLALQDPARVAKDIDISTKWLADELVAAGISKKLGLIRFCFGGARDEDTLCPGDTLRKFEEVIGRGSKAVIFNRRGHGFAHRPETLEDDADAEQAFSIMRNWFYEKLAVGEEVPAS